MSDPTLHADPLLRLAEAICDGVASEGDFAQLDAMMLADVDARRRYLDYCQLHFALRLGLRAQSATRKARRQFDFESVIPILDSSPTEIGGASSGIPAGFLGTALHGTVGNFSAGWPVAYLVATAIVAIGLLIGAAIHVSNPVQMARQSVSSPSPFAPSASRKMEFVGRITGMVDCQWADPQTEAFNGAHVPLGRKYALTSGLMEITYDTGAKVILQGPATYEIESAAGGFLSVGKLTARVESRESRVESNQTITKSQAAAHSPLSTLHSPLFAVRTPTAVVTDLGTEFGVEVDKQGATTSHVFRGQIEVQVLAGNGEPDGTRQVLTEEQAMRIDPVGDTREVVVFSAAKPPDFVRAIPQRSAKLFDLVDVLAGGDGFSGRRGRGIDPISGRPTDTPLELRKDTSPDVGNNGRVNIVDNENYHRVEAMPLVDGVFIPNGRSGAVQVDSAGHTFADFGPTDGITDGMAMQSIWAGGAIPVPSSSMPPWVASLLPSAPPSTTLVRTQLGGVDYAASGRGLIFMHANSGITFDLEAIRRANPSSRLLRFRATVGNTEPMSETGKEVVYADVWVLVDGHVRFRRREINGCSGAFPISFRIAEKDRFLTLAASDSGNGRGGDWILFGDPVMEMSSAVPQSAEE